MCVCVHVSVCATEHFWKLEDTFLELVLSFHLYVGFRVRTQIAQVPLLTEPSCRLSFQEVGLRERRAEKKQNRIKPPKAGSHFKVTFIVRNKDRGKQETGQVISSYLFCIRNWTEQSLSRD